MLAAMALAGCTTGGVDLAGELESAAQTAAAPAPDSPEAVTGEQATLADRAGALPAIKPAGFAGSTPSVSAAVFAPEGRIGPQKVAARSPELDALISRYAAHYGLPEELVRRVVKRESTFNPAARNGPYWGLMQIRHDTARGMGYDGPASGLLDAETNLKYAVRYLRGAWLTAGGNQDQAVRLYARGYYYDAKAKGLLEETGLRPARKRMAEPAVAAAPEPAPPPRVAARARSAGQAIEAVAGR